MAKTSKKRRQKSKNNNPSKKKRVGSSGSSSSEPASLKNPVPCTKSSSSSYNNNKANAPLPPPFPHAANLPVPEKDFLRNVEPYKRTFRTAIETSYEGFTVDKPPSPSPSPEDANKNNDTEEGRMKSYFDHDKIEQALLTMDCHGFFRTDVTQPFGLGTKCAKTYVTRCLLGDEGTTYKYLGLRMFAHPWDTTSTSFKKSSDDDDDDNDNDAITAMKLNESLNIISKLNKDLTSRTKFHLEELEETRRKRSVTSSSSLSQPFVKGRAKYDVALINRMTNAPDLKREPTLGKGKCSVSWHADSSLEHYSSIAVYHTIVSDDIVAEAKDGKTSCNAARAKNMHLKDNEMATKWSIALRCAHHSEGPGASRRGTKIESSVVVDTPPVAVSLPSRSVYYLLDDFNHHHQHAVLVNDDNVATSNNSNSSSRVSSTSSSAGVRYASTHRLLREGHNVNFILERCRVACSQFHKKGPKIFRSEQLLLTEIETEWIRQFYIQGGGHKKNLWKYWEEPICRLLKYWEQLEKRTKQVVDLLQNAAIAHCNSNEKSSSGGLVPTRVERKQKEKQKKALSSVRDLLNRGSDNATNGNPSEILYLPMSEILEERAIMRSLWSDRENERLFKTMESEYWPLPVPFNFNAADGRKSSKESGNSPLGGTAEELTKMSRDLKKYGKAFISKDISHLPKDAVCKSVVECKFVKAPHQEGSSLELEATEKATSYDMKIERGKSDEACNRNVESSPKKMPEQQEISHKASINTIVTRPVAKPSDHIKDLMWKGWSSIKVGLEMQRPWARLLLDNVKTIETRAYDLPRSLIGKKIDILESKGGVDCVSGLSNLMIGEEIDKSVQRVGWAIFDKVIVYRYKAKFLADEKSHCVKPDSNYAWQSNTKLIYGWVVSRCGTYGKQNKKKDIKCLVRRMRSLFEIQA